MRSLYARMAECRVSYVELAARSGVKESTFKSYRTSNAPGVDNIQAVLNAVGLMALPVPDRTILPPALLADLEEAGRRHGVPLPIKELVMVAASREQASC